MELGTGATTVRERPFIYRVGTDNDCRLPIGDCQLALSELKYECAN